MKRLLLLLFLPKLLLAQNLVVNPGFEDLNIKYIMKYCAHTNSPQAFDHDVIGWTTLSKRTVDLILQKNTDSWCIFPKSKTGNASVGIITYLPGYDIGSSIDYHEYLQGTLNEPMQIGQTYKIEFWLQHSDVVAVSHMKKIYGNDVEVLSLAANNIGFYFIEEKLDPKQYVNRLNIKTPHFNVEEVIATANGEWHLISGNFIADKPYHYFIIGNFFTDKMTKTNKNKEVSQIREVSPQEEIIPVKKRIKRIAYYCIDDVNIQKYDPDKIKPIIEIETDKPYTFQNVYFETGESELLPGAEEELAALADFIQSKPAQRFEIGGHTDDVGEAADNQLLSERRARTVYEFLLQLGVNEAQLTYKGYGESLPIADNRIPEGRQQNRRVECKLIV